MGTVRNPVTVREDLPYGLVVRVTADARPESFRFTDPVDALVTAVQYMRDGYWVRLSDPTLTALRAGNGPARLLDAMCQVRRNT